VLPFFHNLSKNYGDLVRMKLGPLTCHLVLHPADVEQVLLKQKEKYEKGVGVRKLKLIMGDGLFLSEGEFWRAQRKLMQPPFTPRGVGQFVPGMQGALARLGHNLGQSAANGEPRDIQLDMMRLALDVISQAMFGTFLDEGVGEVASAFTYILEYVSERSITMVDMPLFVPTSANRRFRRAERAVKEFLNHLIDERKKDRKGRDDLLTRLLHAADEDSGHRMSEQQLKDEVVTLFFAGHETTAQALTWIWYLLARNPQKRVLLEAELDRVLAGRDPDLQDVHHLPFTRAVVDEAMRLYPPVWVFVRQALAEDNLRGYRVDKGSMIVLSPYIVQRDARYFDDPETFLPERFMPDASRPIAPYTYFPFGAGPRVCIGNNFALLEMVLTVATVAQRFHLELLDPEPVLPESKSTLRPSRAVKVRVFARSPSRG
jgi:cytochrome P450